MCFAVVCSHSCYRRSIVVFQKVRRSHHAPCEGREGKAVMAAMAESVSWAVKDPQLWSVSTNWGDGLHVRDLCCRDNNQMRNDAGLRYTYEWRWPVPHPQSPPPPNFGSEVFQRLGMCALEGSLATLDLRHSFRGSDLFLHYLSAHFTAGELRASFKFASCRSVIPLKCLEQIVSNTPPLWFRLLF